MKAHTQGFKTQISTLGRELYSKITYTIDGTQTILTPEELNRIEPVFNSTLLKSSMKELHIDSNVDIPLETEINYQFAMKVNGEYEYLNYGNYIVYSSEFKADTRSYEIVAYDKLLKSMIDYPEEANGRVFPMTVKAFLNMLCTEIGLTYSGKEFTNSDKIIPTDIYSGIRYTYRDIFDEISAVAGGVICLDDDDKVEVRYPSVDLDTTATSNNNTYDITADDNLLKLTIDGKSTQETTTGKNLADNSLYATATGFNGGTYGNYTNYRTTYTTAPTGGYGPYFRKFNFVPGTTYTLSVDIISNANHEIRWGYERSANTTQIGATKTRISYSFTAVEAINQTIVFYCSTLANWHINDWFEISNIQIELGTTSGEFEPYTGGQPSPNPDYPQEIESVGYENLFSGWTIGKGLNSSNGLEITLATGAVSPYIPIDLVNNYYLDGLTNRLWCFISFYDGNKNYIQRTGAGAKLNFSIYNGMSLLSGTLPNTAKFFRITLYENSAVSGEISEVNDLKTQLEKGNRVHSYIPYGKYGIEYKTVGKNLFNGFTSLISGNTYENGVLHLTVSGNSTSNLINNNNYDNVYVSMTKEGGSSRYYFVETDENGIELYSTFSSISRSFSLHSDTKKFRIIIQGLTFPTDISKIQLEEGQATQYEPYQEQTQLITLDEPLRSIGNVKDQLRIENNTLYVDRYIGRVLLNGSESWRLRNTSANNICTYSLETIPNNYALKTNTPVMCNNFTYLGTVTSVSQMYNVHLNKIGIAFYYLTASTSRLTYINSPITTLAEFKTWLSTQNMEVIYELATPTTEVIGSIDTYLLEGVNHITLYSGIETDSELKYASNIDTIDEEFLKDVGVDFGTKYGPINSIVLARSAESDNIYLKDDESISKHGLTEIKIKDNQILNDNNRDQYLKGLLDRLKGVEFYLNDYTSTGVMYYDLLDKYKVKIGDKFYKCIMFNDEPTITQGLVENIYTDEPEKTETDYKKSDTTDKRLNQVTLIVDKQAQTIEGNSTRIDKAHNRIDETELLISSQGTRLEVINKVIDEEGNVLSVRPTEGMKFDINGLEIYQSDNSFNTLIDNEKMQHRDGDNPITETSKDGFMTTVLKQKNQHYYSWNGSGYDFVDERVDSDGEYPYATYYNGSD